MKRRYFISTAGLTGAGLLFAAFTPAAKQKKLKDIKGTFSTLRNEISIYTKADIKLTRIFHITDTHLSIDDERGAKKQIVIMKLRDVRNGEKRDTQRSKMPQDIFRISGLVLCNKIYQVLSKISSCEQRIL
jgi:hypothetical protein